MKNLNDILQEYIESKKSQVIVTEADFIEQKIEQTLEQIKESAYLSSAEHYFEVLDRIQTVLATIVFKDKETVSHKLRKFVRDFDRLDDLELRNYLYSRIKSGEYSL